MALIKCPDCSTSVSDQAASCLSCGYPISQRSGYSAASRNQDQFAPAVGVRVLAAPKVRSTHIILGLLFGGFGFHNFYSGHNLRGGIKIGIFSIAFFLDATTGFHSAFFLVVAVINAIWALIELIAVTEDASGNAMI
jgi:TM2 domain-containing membrane protein YozV